MQYRQDVMQSAMQRNRYIISSHMMYMALCHVHHMFLKTYTAISRILWRHLPTALRVV